MATLPGNRSSFRAALCVPLASLLLSTAGPLCAEPFRDVLQRHLDAVVQRDLPALEETLSPEALTLLLPNGMRLEGAETFLELHREWFADTTWTIEWEVVEVVQGDDWGLASVRSTIRDETPASGRQAWVTLVFRRHEGTWGLVFDQNTRIEAASE